MSTVDLFDAPMDPSSIVERPEYRTPPEGKYLLRVRSAEDKTSSKGTRGIGFEFSMVEALGDQDLEGVDLSKNRVWDDVWFTEASRDYAVERLLAINPESAGMSPKQALREAIFEGSEVIADIKVETAGRDGKEYKRPRLVITRYTSAG